MLRSKTFIVKLVDACCGTPEFVATETLNRWEKFQAFALERAKAGALGCIVTLPKNQMVLRRFIDLARSEGLQCRHPVGGTQNTYQIDWLTGVDSVSWDQILDLS